MGGRIGKRAANWWGLAGGGAVPAAWGEGPEAREAADYSNFGKDARNHSDYGFVPPDYSNYGKVT